MIPLTPHIYKQCVYTWLSLKSELWLQCSPNLLTSSVVLITDLVVCITRRLTNVLICPLCVTDMDWCHPLLHPPHLSISGHRYPGTHWVTLYKDTLATGFSFLFVYNVNTSHKCRILFNLRLSPSLQWWHHWPHIGRSISKSNEFVGVWMKKRSVKLKRQQEWCKQGLK